MFGASTIGGVSFGAAEQTANIPLVTGAYSTSNTYAGFPFAAGYFGGSPTIAIVVPSQNYRTSNTFAGFAFGAGYFGGCPAVSPVVPVVPEVQPQRGGFWKPQQAPIREIPIPPVTMVCDVRLELICRVTCKVIYQQRVHGRMKLRAAANMIHSTEAQDVALLQLFAEI